MAGGILHASLRLKVGDLSYKMIYRSINSCNIINQESYRHSILSYGVGKIEYDAGYDTIHDIVGNPEIKN